MILACPLLGFDNSSYVFGRFGVRGSAARCASTRARPSAGRRTATWCSGNYEAELAALSGIADGEQHHKRVRELRTSRRHGEDLSLTKGGEPRIDRTRVRASERLEGKFVVHTGNDTLRAADMALGYKQLYRVEQ